MPLDENFPTYYFHPLSPTETAIKFTISGSPPQQDYTLLRGDVANTYSLSLHDAHFPTILYATLSSTVSLTPESPPRIVLPKEFTINLHSPDHSITFTRHASILGDSWEFTLPCHCFPQPTNSALDTVYAPPVLDILKFRIKKEGGIISRPQLCCVLAGEGNEPDTVLGMYSLGKNEMVVYESNFRRVELEDRKGLEILMVLGCRVVSEVYGNDTMRVFNVPQQEGKRRPSAGRATTGTPAPIVGQQPVPVNQAPMAPTSAPLQQQRRQLSFKEEEARRKKAAEEEAKKIAAEQAAIREMLRREQEAEQQRIAAETERLRREEARRLEMQRRQSVPQARHPQQQHYPPQPPRPGVFQQSQSHQRIPQMPAPPNQQPRRLQSQQVLRQSVPGASSRGSQSAVGLTPQGQGQKKVDRRKSFLGLFSSGDGVKEEPSKKPQKPQKPQTNGKLVKRSK
ncbi:Similar to hypothetical protein [Tuber melanosporum Mel28]; acc. no. XP_002835387 [Pyronema omphalodes CBS 100304]|uniref:Uncharacterized protein n=1 Tax=Pyronema omphalodes (strain CBS 100304) TaxID=1076935 RepID=U4LQH5_PYROM|nr:Similar to hypothetical protein [Tuber melanosporum Mel28]; acc. no. XP_002835387 [Pyronema omphalodes CBS 100304]